jgi:hypothetical protein
LSGESRLPDRLLAPPERLWHERLAPRQELVSGDVPLTGNRFTYLDRRGCNFEYWNISPFTLRVRESFSIEALELASRHLVAHHDGLRLQVCRRGDAWHQRIVEPHELEHLVRFNYEGHSASAGFVEFVESVLAEAFDGFSFPGPLFKVLLITSDRGRGWVVSTLAHHLTMDASSVGIFLEDFDLAYRQAATRGEVELPPKTTSFLDYARHGTAYWLSRADVLDVWRGLPWRKVQAVPTVVPFAPELNIEASSGHCIESVPVSNESTFWSDDPDGTDGSMASVLAAISCAFGEWTGQAVALITMLIDGRSRFAPAIDLSRTIGYFNEFVPILLPTDRTLPEVRAAALRQLAHVKAAGASYGVYRHLSSDPDVRMEFADHPIPQISLNAFPLRAWYANGSSIGESTDEFIHPPGTKPTTHRAFLLSAGVFYRSGRFCIGWDFSEQLFDKTSVASFAGRCMRYFLSQRTETNHGGGR